MTPQITRPELWGDPDIRWDEDAIQAAVVTTLHRLEKAGAPFTFAGDQNAAKRGPRAASAAKAMGMRAGEPDIRIYLNGGRALLIELKTDRGQRSKEQIARHGVLSALGWQVHTLRCRTPAEAIGRVLGLLSAEEGQWGWSKYEPILHRQEADNG